MFAYVRLAWRAQLFFFIFGYTGMLVFRAGSIFVCYVGCAG